MLKRVMGTCSLIAVACLWALSAFAVAETSANMDVPAGQLVTALKALAKQSDVELVYQPEQLKDIRTAGVKGSYSAQEAVGILLKGTGLRVYAAESGAMVIAPASVERTGENGTDEPRMENLRMVQSSPSPSQGEGAKRADEGGKIGEAPKDADEEKSRIQEIVVTAQKREERSIDVPMSITALSGEKLAEAGIKNALDLSYAVPGMAVLETGPGRQAIVLRGVFSQRGTSSLTGVYLDEMPVSGVQDGGIPMYADLRTIDLERVEVLKGPQGTLFGEGAAGGVVRFITKDPDLIAVGGEVSAEFFDTTDGGWSSGLTGVLNAPLAENVFGIRIAGSYEDKAGWIDQPTIGRENINDAEVKHVRAKALFKPLPGLKIKGMIEVHRDTGGASNIVNQTPLEDSNFRQAFDLFAPTSYTNDYDLYNLTVSYDLRFAELLSSTSHARFDSLQNFTQLLEGVPTPWLESFSPLARDAELTSQEIRLTSTADGPFNWTLGGSFKDSELNGSSTGNSIKLFGGSTSLQGLEAGLKNIWTSKSWAGFGDVSYEFPNHFEIGGGLRYFSDDRETLSQAGPGVPIVSGGQGSFNKLTYRTYAKYKPTNDVSFYASLATGFRSGGFNTPANVARGAPPTVGEENTKFYELGAKAALLNGRVRVDAAVFYGEFTDMQENLTTISPVNNQPITYAVNGQDAELRGVEWDIAWGATDRLTLTLAGDVTDSEITNIEPSVNTIYRLGDPINLVPKYSLSTSADYRFSWSASVPGFALVTFNRQGKSYNTRRNSAFILVPQTVAEQKSFLDASIGGEWNGWDLSLFGRNLLDEEKLLFPTENGWSAQARPRTFGVTIRKEF